MSNRRKGLWMMGAGGLGIVVSVVLVVFAVVTGEPWTSAVAHAAAFPSGVLLIGLGYVVSRAPDSRK